MSEFWAGRRALVTGATGMVGSWLVRDLLAHGANVVALVPDADPSTELVRSGDITRCTVVNGTLEDLRALERAVLVQDVDTVFHLGAQTLVGPAMLAPLATFETNIRGSYNLLDVCRMNAERIRAVIVASSDKAYGTKADLPYREDMSLEGSHPYEVSKSCTDLLARAYHVTYGLPTAIARCGNVFGGGDLNWSRIVPGTVRSIIEGRAPVLRSDGRYVRDYIYVEDAAAAYRLLAERIDDTAGRAFNFSNEEPMSVFDVVALIQKLMGSAIDPIVLNSARGEIRDQYLDASLARADLSWAPRFGIEDGMRRTIEWYTDFLEAS